MRMQGPAAKRSRPGDACKGQKHERSETQEVRHGERWQMIFRSSQLVRLFPRDVGQFDESTSFPNASSARNHIGHACLASKSMRATRRFTESNERRNLKETTRNPTEVAQRWTGQASVGPAGEATGSNRPWHLEQKTQEQGHD